MSSTPEFSSMPNKYTKSLEISANSQGNKVTNTNVNDTALPNHTLLTLKCFSP